VAVKIRLLRVGKAKQPSYRVVVADSRSPRNGRIIETIGHYGPRAEPSTVDINAERALAWLRQGAQPTEQVQKLLTSIGIWSTFESEKGHPIVTKLNRRGFSTGKVATPTKAAPAPVKADTAPVKADTAPVSEDTAPAKADTAPVSEDTAPAKADTAPVSEDPAPAAPVAVPVPEAAGADADADENGAGSDSEETAS
jgi:small subunit ribosomal protein S16